MNSITIIILKKEKFCASGRWLQTMTIVWFIKMFFHSWRADHLKTFTAAPVIANILFSPQKIKSICKISLGRVVTIIIPNRMLQSPML